jgi:hypothetical protein
MTIRVSDLPEALARKRMNEMLEICQQTNTKPRLALVVAQLQHLAMTNERLREALENASKITNIHGKRPPR